MSAALSRPHHAPALELRLLPVPAEPRALRRAPPSWVDQPSPAGATGRTSPSAVRYPEGAGKVACGATDANGGCACPHVRCIEAHERRRAKQHDEAVKAWRKTRPDPSIARDRVEDAFIAFCAAPAYAREELLGHMQSDGHVFRDGRTRARTDADIASTSRTTSATNTRPNCKARPHSPPK